MPSKTIEDFAYQVRDYMRSAEVVEGKNYIIQPYNNYEVDGTGVIYTPIEDGKVKANGTPTSSGGCHFRIYGCNDIFNKIIAKGGQWVLSGCPEGGSSNGYRVHIGGTQIIETGDGYIFNASDLQSALQYGQITLANYGATANNIVYKPMICTKEEWDRSHTYEPYYVPVKDRVDELEDIKTYTIKNGDTAVTGVSVIKLGRWVLMNLTNVNVGTFLGATIPNEIKPLADGHFFGVVRDTNSAGVQWQGLLDLTTGTRVQYIYYTDTYNTMRKDTNTTSTNLIISATAIYLSAI